MKYYMFNQEEREKIKPKLNKRKIINVTICILVVIAIASVIITYFANESAREFVDKYILRKEIEEDNAATISIDMEATPYIHAYNKHITILDKNVLKYYNNSGKNDANIDVSITTPIFSSNNRFLAVAEKNGQKLYFISETKLLWQKEIEGNITSMQVNKNGYVAVVVSGTIYRNIVLVYSPEGKELFTTFISNNYVIDVDISNDNQYLAIAEMNFSGTLIQSYIRFVSIDKAQTSANESVVYNYSAKANDMITNIKYQDKNKLICMYDTGIHKLVNGEDTVLVDFEEKDLLFSDINLSNSLAKIMKISSGIFSVESELQFIETENLKNSVYHFDGVPKAMYSNGDMVAINLGTECLFVNKSGWLVKKYISYQEINSVVLCDGLAGIIYKNKIELIHI